MGSSAVPMGFDYRCTNCGHDWMLFSTRFTLGPVQWGKTTYTCFSCQTFLSIAVSVDANSWSVWYRNNAAKITGSPALVELAGAIESLLNSKRGLAPVQLAFDPVACPTCGDSMSTVPFGQHLMKCPQCGRYAGEFDGSDGICIYGYG